MSTSFGRIKEGSLDKNKIEIKIRVQVGNIKQEILVR